MTFMACPPHEGKSKHGNSPLVLECLVVPSDQVTTDEGLEVGDDLGQTLVTHVLQHTQHTSPEEHLGVAQSVFILVQLQSIQDLLSDNLAINESLRDSVGGQDGVTGKDRKEAIIYQCFNRELLRHLYSELC